MPAYQTLSGEALGTTWSVTWRGADQRDVQNAIVSTLERIDARMSTWRPDSELSRLRQSTGPFPVSPETFSVVQSALDLAGDTNGAFDPTVEPLLELWGFRGKRRDSPVTDAELAQVMGQIGYDKIKMHHDLGVGTIETQGAALDLSAIAKGYAVDAVGQAISTLGSDSWLVEIGGEVRVAGPGASGIDQPWRLALDNPAKPSSTLGTLNITNTAIATSGNYRNAYQLQGQLVAHTMDPRTGRTSTNPPLSVTVFAPDCQSADGWATALMVLGLDAGRPLIEARPELDALWVIPDGNGATKVVGTENATKRWTP